ncbi:hypothetical protein B296_00044511 [Ensete ventricosum]|uniref:Uncharacterized protein n=1 Tax=Ensete ventricosum TaxID=4639 RepID=A0A426XX68_ENSVE|nr:hypothetical protein B296_00044511 [Ensete ventricosum]
MDRPVRAVQIGMENLGYNCYKRDREGLQRRCWLQRRRYRRLEMATLGRGRRGVGAGDNNGDAAREPNVCVSAAVAGGRWGHDNSGTTRGSAGAVGGYDSKLEGVTIVEQGRRQRRQWHRRKERPTMRKKRKKMRATVGVRRESAVNAERAQDFTDPGQRQQRRLLQSLRSDRSTRKGGSRDGSGRGAAMLLVRVEKKATATAMVAAWAVGGDERQWGGKAGKEARCGGGRAVAGGRFYHGSDTN